MASSAYQYPGFETDDRLSARDFEQIAGLVGDITGIKLPQGKLLMVEGRLRKRIRALGHASIDHYCSWLFGQGGLELELPHLIDAVTTNKTDFFREPQHYDFLAKTAVPGLIADRKGYNPLIKVWSAACSNGAEAFSAAMVLDDLQRQRQDFHYAILGTDVSTSMLNQACRAIYPADWMEPVSRGFQNRYVMQSIDARMHPEVRMVPELRRRTSFRHLNLMDTSFPIDRDVDVIFLRNVLIYFEKPVQEEVISKLIGHLRPGGYLLLGHSESMIGSQFPVTQVATATFRKN